VRAFDVDLVLVRRIAFRELDFLFLTMIQEPGRASNAGKRQGSFGRRGVNAWANQTISSWRFRKSSCVSSV